MNKLRLASFGLRGFAGESLPPLLIIDFASAFATYVEGGRVLIGRDTRTSSPMLHAAAVSGLLSAGCDVVDLGVCPTPLVQFAVPRLGAAGALSVSGGHNSMGWNAMTLIGADGAVLEPWGGEAVLDSYHGRNFLKQDWQRMGTIAPMHDVGTAYFDALVKHVNAEAIREAGFTVLIDPVGGAGCAYLAPFAQQFNLRLIPINAQPSGYLAREPEPRPRSALQMASIISHVRGDAGFVLSSDMGRMSIVTEAGEPTSEEYTLALIANHMLARRSGTVVTNGCTTRTVDDLAARHQAPVVKTRVGQAYVMSAVRDHQATLGGEGSGSVADPAFSPAFDGFLMMARALEAMAESEQPLSALVNALPRYHIVKRSVPCGSREGYRALDILKERPAFVGDGKVDVTDGFRVDWADSWIHVRASQTQQLIRVIAEAREASLAEQRADEAMRLLLEGL